MAIEIGTWAGLSPDQVCPSRVADGSRCWSHPNRLVGDARDTVGNARRNGRGLAQVRRVVSLAEGRLEASRKLRLECEALGIDPAILTQSGRAARKARRALKRARK